MRAVLAWADGSLRAARTACIIDPDNLPSLRVAAHCGYRERVRTTYKGSPTVLLERMPA
jgi:RimJ/RimL family protein N-acetyltransferase